jgi:hypothetical protein
VCLPGARCAARQNPRPPPTLLQDNIDERVPVIQLQRQITAPSFPGRITFNVAICRRFFWRHPPPRCSELRAQSASAQTCTAPCYARTAAEIAAGVTPTNTAYPQGNVRRYGADPTGAADSTGAIQNALNVAGSVYIAAGTGVVSGCQLASVQLSIAIIAIMSIIRGAACLAVLGCAAAIGDDGQLTIYVNDLVPKVSYASS